MVKLLIAYYSSTGNGTKMAHFAQKAAEDFGAEVRLRQIPELAPDVAIDANPLWRKNVEATKDIPIAKSDDLIWADAFVFSSPSRFGVMAAQMKQFMDMQGGLWFAGKLANKAITAFSSAQNAHGGQEEVIQSIYTVAQHWGCLIVPPGYVDEKSYGSGGNPYGTSATITPEGKMVAEDEVDGAINAQVKRLLSITTILAGE
ncbi:NAD(P)H:quinone oxidoreductase type IV [Enterococcus timonensis]|uniref:NAD(P)H:quinone oxidoreductase type IV n=1 Tax=Enterococcus timonensis TaxID=1852364 RepID=UPI000A71A230|nr:NAD(P)H:quinone oxidoreductase type IV [Enterococcus timonensis]